MAVSDQLILGLAGTLASVLIAYFSARPALAQAKTKNTPPVRSPAAVAISAFTFSIAFVALIVALWPKSPPQMRTIWKQTEFPHTEKVVTAGPWEGYAYDIVDFGEPVDAVIPQGQSYMSNIDLWAVHRLPEDDSGRRWRVVYKSAVASVPKIKTQASFVAIVFPK
ncbi:MAG: hypothetical protein EOP50_03835 [Sphingobacteriales bacterium]|nr:MAG: hypothetical protein EOP50_03835 [Sphingobacteriales bacterium]